jgi:hypothetical protein
VTHRLSIAGGKDQYGPYRRFIIRDRHTAYEWAMVLADRHPYSAFLNVYGVGMDARFRLRAIEVVPEAAAIYRAIEAALDAGEIAAAPVPKQNWYDPPADVDPTQRILGVEAMLTVIRKLGAAGRIIGKLLAQYPEPEDALRPTTAAEKKAKEWLIDLMSAGNPTKSKAQYYKECKFSIRKRAFTRAWANAVAITKNTKWSYAGRRKSPQ